MGTNAGQFNQPKGAAVSPFGEVYVADTYNDRIQRFDGNGAFLSQWGTSGKGDGQFQYPNAVATDRDGNVYVASYNFV